MTSEPTRPRGVVAAVDPDTRAVVAERLVTALFGGRMFGLPFTHLGRVVHPAQRRPTGPWHYWWQAHYLDAVVDAGLRALRSGDVAGAETRARRGDRLLNTIRLRNLGRFTNLYYDDMAWLALAVGRLTVLHEAIGLTRRRRRREGAELALTAQLRSAVTDDLGGGVFWNTTRDLKNVPATAPVALHLARLGRSLEAARLVDWLYARLVGDTGLFLDGIRTGPDGEQVVADVYTYNQGTVLGALVTLGDAQSLCRGADLVHAIADGLTGPDAGRLVLTTHGGGDGGLFTGILARYLALAAGKPRLAEETRRLAASMVEQTAAAFWAGRVTRPTRRDAGSVVFPSDPLVAAERAGPVELSTQLQAWMTLEAAAVVAARGPGRTPPVDPDGPG